MAERTASSQDAPNPAKPSSAKPAASADRSGEEPNQLPETTEPSESRDLAEGADGPCAHLLPSLIPLLDLPTEARVLEIKKARWSPYPRATEIKEWIGDMVNDPLQSRPPCGLVIGESNSGKSFLSEQIEEAHPPQERPEEEAACVPLLLIQAPPVDAKEFLIVLFMRLAEKAHMRRSDDPLLVQAVELLRRVSMRVLLIDEIHVLFRNTSPAKQRRILDVLKYLSNEVPLSIVGFGVGEAENIMQVDPQWANRFEPMHLPRWAANRDTAIMLKTMERRIPLKKPSHLGSTAMMTAIVNMTGGLLGEIRELLKQAAVKAAREGGECITEELLRSCKYKNPSNRRTRPEQL